ncbi:hypothetical protein CMI47_01035 [Candidatus Pacearchaeota archaeon]|nr:hypothetical protein [Candidatus Pacearchaeota archaeon]|tara:strand:- start:719 stop:1309 length:591 start_codon:yes stop_codon:yes gene_type:complete
MRSPNFARTVPWDNTISIVIRVSNEMTRFGEKLRAWRKSARVSQASLERVIGRNRGWVNSHEKGVTKPPDKGTCDQIAQALGLADPVVWAAARAERLRGFDEDLWRWYEGTEGETTSTSFEVSREMSDSDVRYVTIQEFREVVESLTERMRNLVTPEEKITQMLHDYAYTQKRNALVVQGRWAPPPLEKRKSDDPE